MATCTGRHLLQSDAIDCGIRCGRRRSRTINTSSTSLIDFCNSTIFVCATVGRSSKKQRVPMMTFAFGFSLPTFNTHFYASNIYLMSGRIVLIFGICFATQQVLRDGGPSTSSRGRVVLCLLHGARNTCSLPLCWFFWSVVPLTYDDIPKIAERCHAL